MRRAALAGLVAAAGAGPLAEAWRAAQGGGEEGWARPAARCAIAFAIAVLVVPRVLRRGLLRPARPADGKAATEPGGERWGDRHVVLPLLALLACGAMVALVGPAGLLFLPLAHAATRLRRKPRPRREWKTVRDAFLVAFATLVFTGSAASLAGAAGVTVLAAAILPGIHAGLAVRRARGRRLSGEAPAGRGAVLSLAATTLAALALFLVLPRPGGAAAAEPASAARYRDQARRSLSTGEARSTAEVAQRRVSVGEIGRLQQDYRPILEITVLRRGAPADAEDLGPLFRSGALETFDGWTWETTDRAGVLRTDGMDGKSDGFVTVGRKSLPAGEAVEQRLRFFVGNTDSLFCLGMPTAVGGEGARGGILLLPRGEARTPAAYGDGTGFTIRSLVVKGEYPEVDRETPTVVRMEALLDVPPGHDRAAALARASLGGLPEGRPLLRGLESLLGRRCRYSLDIPSPGAATPVEAFLFDSRRGHCELFASSAAVMLRALGVPARMVIGFRGGLFDRIGKRYTLRGADAHAWVEAWFPGEGWLSFDPTPPAEGSAAEPAAAEEPAVESRKGPSLLDRLVGYDAGEQRRLVLGAARSVVGALRNVFLRPDGSLWLAWPVLILGALGLLVAAGALRDHRSAGRLVADGPVVAPPPPQPEAWRTLVARLAAAGIRRAPSETGTELAERGLAAGAAPAAAVRDVARAYAAERWGGRVPEPAERAALLSLASSVAVPGKPPPPRA
jgi:hypothetical protein